MRVDYLTGTTSDPLGRVLEYLHRLTGGGEVAELEHGMWRYGRAHKVAGLVTVLSEPADEAMPPVCVDVRGEGCAWLGLHRTVCVGAFLERLTRIDFAWDGAGFTPAQAAAAATDRNLNTRALSMRYIDGYGAGDTFYLGSRQSDRQLCIYDRRGATRVEFRLRRAAAEEARAILEGEVAAISTSALEQLRGFVDFVDRGAVTNVSRAPLLAFWGAFVAGVERVRAVVRERTMPSVTRRLEWLRGSVAATMAALEDAGLNVRELLEDGRCRMAARHRALTFQAVALGGLRG